MLKWKQFYRLKVRKLNEKYLKDEAGITLVELLAALAILSVVILLAGSVHMFGQRQFIEQTKSASQENDISYAMTVMTTDLRRKRPEQTVEISGTKIEVPDKFTYELVDSTLKKGSITLADGVTGSFIDVKNSEGVHIKINTLAGVRPSKKYETTIYFRRLPNDQK